MAQYTPPLRDMQFVMHELLDAVPQLHEIPAYADLDVDSDAHLYRLAHRYQHPHGHAH